MRDLSEFEKGWIAALIDGEGTICLAKIKRSKARCGYRYRANLNITNTSFPIIDKAYEILGMGNVAVDEARAKWNRKRPIKILLLSSNDLREFLPIIKNSLISKKKQAEIMIEALELLKENSEVASETTYQKRLEQIDKNTKLLDTLYEEMWKLNGHSQMSSLAKNLYAR